MRTCSLSVHSCHSPTASYYQLICNWYSQNQLILLVIFDNYCLFFHLKGRNIWESPGCLVKNQIVTGKASNHHNFETCNKKSIRNFLRVNPIHLSHVESSRAMSCNLSEGVQFFYRFYAKKGSKICQLDVIGVLKIVLTWLAFA